MGFFPFGFGVGVCFGTFSKIVEYNCKVLFSPEEDDMGTICDKVSLLYSR